VLLLLRASVLRQENCGSLTLRLSSVRENDEGERDEDRKPFLREARKGDEQAKVQGTTRVACYIDRT